MRALEPGEIELNANCRWLVKGNKTSDLRTASGAHGVRLIVTWLSALAAERQNRYATETIEREAL